MHIIQIPLGHFRKKSVKKIGGQEKAAAVSKCKPFPSNDAQEVYAMSIPIRAEDVRQALSPMLGDAFLFNTPLCADAADCLREYSPAFMTLDAMFGQVRERIFGDLYEALGPGMVLTLETGIRLRLRLKDVDTLADAALGVLLDALPANLLPLTVLRAYALDSGLLSPLRVLLQRYGSVLPSMEREMLQRIVRENHPADRYSDWLQ